MKLTDAQIEQEIDDNYALEKLQQPNSLELNRFRFGARFAREFYENQKCETCDNHANDESGYCSYLDFSTRNGFGCSEWEEKSE